MVKEDSPTVIFLESILLLLDVYYEMIINQKKRGKVLLVGFDAKQRL